MLFFKKKKKKNIHRSFFSNGLICILLPTSSVRRVLTFSTAALPVLCQLLIVLSYTTFTICIYRDKNDTSKLIFISQRDLNSTLQKSESCLSQPIKFLQSPDTFLILNNVPYYVSWHLNQNFPSNKIKLYFFYQSTHIR